MYRGQARTLKADEVIIRPCYLLLENEKDTETNLKQCMPSALDFLINGVATVIITLDDMHAESCFMRRGSRRMAGTSGGALVSMIGGS